MSAGVYLRSFGNINGMVPVFEEHEARLERNIGLDDWLKMNVDERALVIATRRVRIALGNLQNEAELKKIPKGKGK